MLKSKRKFKGAVACQTSQSKIVFGAPSGLVQHLLKSEFVHDKREILVDTVFLSDLTVISHTSQQDIEFLFFTAMFLGMNFKANQPCSLLYDFSKGKIIRKFRVFVPKGREQNVYDQVEFTLFGARREFMKKNCKLSDDIIDILATEQENWYLKNEGKPATVYDLVEVIAYDENSCVELDDLIIEQKGSGFKITDKNSQKLIDEFDLFFEGTVEPAWRMPQKKKAVDLSGISLIPLGTASPFNPDEPSTCYWLQIRGEGHFLIDCGFLTWQCFEANGGDLSQLRGIIITHGHGDHIDLTAFMNRSCKLEIWTTNEIYEMAKRITCAKANISLESFESHFVYIPIKAAYPGKDGEIKGESKYIDDLELRFHYSIHSIPTIGMNLWKDGKKLVAFSSDMCDFETMYKLKNAGVISEARCELLRERLSNEGNLDCWILLDCGGDGFIHGKIESYMPFYDNNDKVVMCHRERRLPGEKLPARLSEPLTVYKIKTGDEIHRAYQLIRSYLNSLDLAKEINKEVWAITIAEQMELIHVPHNTVILEENKTISEDFYIISSGNCSIQIMKKVCGKLVSGDSFGEYSFLPHDFGDCWPVSILSISPLAYFKFPVALMKSLLTEDAMFGGDVGSIIMNELRYISTIQLSILASRLNIPTRFFKDFVDRIEEIYYKKGRYLFRIGDVDDGHLYIIYSGSVAVEKPDSKQVIIENYNCVGERVASGKSNFRNANVYTLEPSILLKISHEDFYEIMNRIPSFSNRVFDISESRAAE